MVEQRFDHEDSTLPQLLLIEDNEGDIILFEEAFRAAALDVDLTVLRDGEEALDYLFDPKQPKPKLILLDLNLPKIDGWQVLKRIKQDAYIHNIPVVVLTSSSAPRDVKEVYRLLGNSYIVKPVDIEAYTQAIHTIYKFWFRTVLLPQT